MKCNSTTNPFPEVPGSLRLSGKEAAKNRCIAALAVGIPTLAAVLGGVLLCLGVIHFRLADLAIAGGMYTVTGLGVTAGLHRHFTHKSFETSAAIQALLAIFGIMALQGNVSGWVACHRRHHRFSDIDGDPHSPVSRHRGILGSVRALFFVHFSRLFQAEDTSVPVYAPDMLSSSVVRRVDRLAGLWIVLTLAIPATAGWLLEGGVSGALSGLLWGGLVRIFLGQHIGSCVNSVCHMFGRAHFKTTDASKNNLWIGLAAFGEGWHNNHHAFPCSAKQGLLWWQLDLSYMLIATLKFFGLAWNVKVPSAELQLSRRVAPVTG